MKASFKANFNIADIKKMYEDAISVFDQAIINRLSFVGEKFVINARKQSPKWKYIEQKFEKGGSDQQKVYYRNGKSYTRTPGGGESFSDWSGNLRSSIKYFILKDGEIIKGQSFSKNQPGNLEQDVISKVSEEFPKGFVLVCLAGMEYAAAVESKNYDVITSSSITAENDLKKSLDELRNKIKGKKK